MLARKTFEVFEFSSLILENGRLYYGIFLSVQLLDARLKHLKEERSSHERVPVLDLKIKAYHFKIFVDWLTFCEIQII